MLNLPTHVRRHHLDVSVWLLAVAAAGIWDYFQGTLLPKFASFYNGVTVVMGPAFDYNYDGQHDTPGQIKQ